MQKTLKRDIRLPYSDAFDCSEDSRSRDDEDEGHRHQNNERNRQEERNAGFDDQKVEDLLVMHRKHASHKRFNSNIAHSLVRGLVRKLVTGKRKESKMMK